MTTQVLLLRGINVGGHGKLPMVDLCAAIKKAGGRNVRTYIQSGNAVFDGDVTEAALRNAIEARASFRPHNLLMAAADFHAIRAANPFPEATEDPKALHVGFLSAPLKCREADLKEACGPEERVALTSKAIYLHTPKYLSGSVLAPKLDARLGVPMTMRNWRTVEKISAMLEAQP